MSREKQRANRRKKDRDEKLAILTNFVKYGVLPEQEHLEEELDRKNNCGLDDPTPYKAVENMIRGASRSLSEYQMEV